MGGTQRDALLDGLRGAAAVAVVYYHYVYLTGISPRPGGGNAGVLVFFVLSGYLITRGLWRDTTYSWSRYRAFVHRRVMRLYPALICVVVAAIPLMAWLGPEENGGGPRTALIVLAQLTSFVQADDGLPMVGWLHTWSLTVEWVFYVLWPLAVIALHRLRMSARAARRVALVAAAVLYLVSMPLAPKEFYYLPVANVAVMLVGAALALAHAQRAEGRYPGREAGVSSLAFLLLLLMVFLPVNTTGAWIYRVSTFPAAIVAAYFVIDQRPDTRGLVERVLESRPLVAVGRSSYSLYLWHLPALWIVWWSLPGLGPLGRCGIAISALFPLVWLTFRYLEKPWLGLPDPSAGRARLARAQRIPSRLQYPRFMSSLRSTDNRAWWLPN